MSKDISYIIVRELLRLDKTTPNLSDLLNVEYLENLDFHLYSLLVEMYYDDTETT